MTDDSTKTIPYGDSHLCDDGRSIWRPKWFLITRSFAVVAAACAIIAADSLIHITTIHYGALWVLTAALLASNIGYYLYYRLVLLTTSCETPRYLQRQSMLVIVQVNVDLALLTLMLHFSGGATNPFSIYYVFHMIISSILLTKRVAYFEAAFAAALFTAMTILEGTGVITHYPVFMVGYHAQPWYIFGASFALTSALFISVYMATSIMDRLRRHQRELEQSLVEIQKLEEEKSRFMDVVAHDLKSPIAAVETMINTTLSVHQEKLDEDIVRLLGRINNRLDNLSHFINELLEFSHIRKLDQYTVEYKTLNFLPIVTATIEMYMSQAMEHGIRVSIQSQQSLPPVRGNRRHLERVVGNLISNAIRYTPDNGSVNVKVTSDGNEVILTVSDTGIGIPEEAMQNIFTQFYRAPNARKHNSSGTGLGMSITRKIVEQHGGTISVQSEEGVGTAFTVRLPVTRQS